MTVWEHTNNPSLSLTYEKMKQIMKEGKRIHDEHELKQAGLNLDLLSMKCKVCGHTPKLKGGIATGSIHICTHLLKYLKENLPKHPQPPSDFPYIGRPFNGIELVIDPKSLPQKNPE